MTASRDWTLPESIVDMESAVFEPEWETEEAADTVEELLEGEVDFGTALRTAERNMKAEGTPPRGRWWRQWSFLRGLNDVHEWQNGVALSYALYPLVKCRDGKKECHWYPVTQAGDPRGRWRKATAPERFSTAEHAGSFCLGASRSMAVRATFGLEKPTYKDVLKGLNTRIESAKKSSNTAAKAAKAAKAPDAAKAAKTAKTAADAAEAAGFISRIVSHQHGNGPISQFNEDIGERYGLTNVEFQIVDRKAASAALKQGARVMVDLRGGWHWVMVAMSPEKELWVVDPLGGGNPKIWQIKETELGTRAEIMVDKTTNPREPITPDQGHRYQAAGQSGKANEMVDNAVFELEWETEPALAAELESPFADTGFVNELEDDDESFELADEESLELDDELDDEESLELQLEDDPRPFDIAERISAAAEWELEFQAAQPQRQPARRYLFTAEEVKRALQAYRANATAAAANQADKAVCIVMLNVGIGQLLGLKTRSHPARKGSSHKVQMPALSTHTMEKAMAQLQKLGLASKPTRIDFLDDRNVTAGNRAPKRLRASLKAQVLRRTGTKPGWYAFGLSIFDGFHTVLLLVKRTSSGAQIWWLDQHRVVDVSDTLDDWITDRTTRWWQAVLDKLGKRFKTTVSVWPLRTRS